MMLAAPAILRDYVVVSNRAIADGVFELVLRPASDGDRIPDPRAGQWVMLHLLEESGTIFGKNPYSIANAPDNVVSSGRIELVIRTAGAFTRRAQALQEGDRAKLQGPFGVFTLAEGATRHAFFAGGIGITPLRSMILALLARQPETPIILFYSSRTAREAAFLAEFREIAASHLNVSFIPTFTREIDHAVEEERGRISDALVRRHLGTTDGLACYVCGPRPFMEEVMGILERIGVPKAGIHSEKFG